MKTRLRLTAFRRNDERRVLEFIGSAIIGERAEGQWHTVGGFMQADADLSALFDLIGSYRAHFEVTTEIVIPLADGEAPRLHTVQMDRPYVDPSARGDERPAGMEGLQANDDSHSGDTS